MSMSIMCVLDTVDTLDWLDIQDTLDRLGIADTANTLDRADMKHKMNTVNPAAHHTSTLLRQCLVTFNPVGCLYITRLL